MITVNIINFISDSPSTISDSPLTDRYVEYNNMTSILKMTSDMGSIT